MTSPRSPLSFLVLSASLQRGSLNTQLAKLAAETLESNGATAEVATLGDYDAPSYDADVESRSGLPRVAERFRQRLELTDGFVIASPEYNASYPGGLKNLIDWTSRHRPQPFNERHGLLLSASPSMVGGNRGLWALRVPFEHLGARIYPDMFSLAQAHHAFDGDGRLANPELEERFESTIVNFMNLVEAATHYPCVKKAWTEFLGETPDPMLDRVDVAS